MDTVRIARDFGTVAELLPDGVTDLRDCPHTVFYAIRSALIFLSFDELPDDERPPKHLYDDIEQLSAWFAEVKKRRDEKYGGKRSSGEIEDPQQNDAAKSLLVG